MSTGMRSPIGHAEIEEIRKKAYDSVMKQDLTGIVGDEVEKTQPHCLSPCFAVWASRILRS